MSIRRSALPKALHRRLSLQANRQGLTGERKDAYVYGTMNKVKKFDSDTVKRRIKRKKIVDPHANSNGD